MYLHGCTDLHETEWPSRELYIKNRIKYNHLSIQRGSRCGMHMHTSPVATGVGGPFVMVVVVWRRLQVDVSTIKNTERRKKELHTKSPRRV